MSVHRIIVAALAGLLLAACGAASANSPDDDEPFDPLESVSAEELYRRGTLLSQAGDYIRAEQYLAAAIQRGFPEERAMPALMAACVEASRLVAALQYAEPYLARHPDHWTLRMLVASIHMGLDHHVRARDELERVVRDAPDDPPQAHYFLGVLYRDQFDDEAQAAEHFGRYLALAPDGEHTEEARAGLPRPEGSPRLPQRVPMREEPAEPPAEAPAPAEEAAP